MACGNSADNYRPYLGIGGIQRKDQTGSSNYNALEASLRHNIGGLELNAAYTYSHSIDDSSDYNDLGFLNSYALNAYRASSNFDQRHNITVAYVYDVPIFRAKGLAHRCWAAGNGRHNPDSEWISIQRVQPGNQRNL